MELLYNPDVMPEEEIKATFVARQPLVDELVEMIEKQPDGAGVQHVVIIAPRGMGKTTVLLMVKYAIKDRGLSEKWQTVKFPEESYSIYDLADFWIEVLNLLSVETGDAAPEKQAEELKKQYKKNDDLQEAAFAAIKDWRKKNGKRLVLFVENFDMILSQINDEKDNASLRDTLMNDGTVMLICGATTFFKEARAYDKPLYNFFKIYNLYDLKFEQMQELLSRRAEVDKIKGFDPTSLENRVHLRALEYFTGGNPRLVLMLYRVVSQSNITEVRKGLEKLLDEVTPFYKAKIEALPPQQRKIVDYIAQVSSKTSDGLTPGEIAEAVRLPANQVSSQLKRLSEIGYVRSANLRGRSSYYTLSEPLYAIWHQMRFGRAARRRMGFLINFLRVFYSREEFITQSEKMDGYFRDHVKSNRLREARDTLEYHSYLAEAMEDAPMRSRAMERVISGYLDIKETELIKRELLAIIELKNLSDETLNRLLENGCVSKEKIEQAKLERASVSPSPEEKKVSELIASASLAYFAGKLEEAISYLNEILTIKPDDDSAWYNRGVTLANLGRYEEAVESYNKAIKINPNRYESWYNRGITLDNLNRYEDAIESYNKAIEIRPNYDETWNNRGGALFDLDRYEEAVESYNKAIEVNPDSYGAWYNRGNALRKLNRYKEAVESYNKAIRINPDSYEAWCNQGIALSDLSQYEEAIENYNKAINIKRDNYEAWYNRGTSLLNLNRYEEAIESYDKAIEIKPDKDSAWYNRGYVYLEKFVALIKQGKFDLAKQDWQEALISGEKSNNDSWFNDVSDKLLEVAQLGHLDFVRQLITESDLEERLFPLARAIDYLQTGDEALIEKLSPEVKGIVEEVVASLQPTEEEKETG